MSKGTDNFLSQFKIKIMGRRKAKPQQTGAGWWLIFLLLLFICFTL